MDQEEEEMPKVKHRGSTLKPEIAKNRSKGIKLNIEYNSLGSHIGENSVQLSSYLGTITRTHVPIIVESWRKVPKETKEKLWDLITRRGIGRVDRSVLWKKAREKKGKFNKITSQNAKEIGLPPPGPNDILGQALGKPDHPGRVVGQDRLVRPSSYFHQPSDDMKKIKEEIWEMVRKEMEDAATRQVMSPPHPILIWVIKCKLAVERKGNVVATGTLIEEKGSNRLVVINVAHKPDARLPFPNPYGIINVGDAIGFELHWPTSLVILETEHPQVLDKGKKKIVKTPIIRKSKPQNHSVIKNFQKFVDGCLVIEPRKMIVHYLDPMHHKPCEDLKDICPRQEGGFECGYFVMRFIKEIIFDPTIIASKFGDKKTYSQVEFDEIRGEWATFVLQLIMNHVDAS
ncbi:hypothetical protein AAG906_022208 [Vitis piasezkii]